MLSRFLGKISFPQVNIKISEKTPLDLNMRKKSQIKCSVVLVAGEALEQVAKVEEIVETIGEQLAYSASIVVLLVEHGGFVMNTSRKQISPPVVNIISTFNYIS